MDLQQPLHVQQTVFLRKPGQVLCAFSNFRVLCIDTELSEVADAGHAEECNAPYQASRAFEEGESESLQQG